MEIRDASDWSPMSYEQAVYWLIQNKDTAWVESGKLSARAIVIADLFKRSPNELRNDVRMVMPTSEKDWESYFSPDYRTSPWRIR